MDADELELLDKSVRGALTSEPDADDALAALGWHDLLTEEPRAAVTVVFTALGDLNADGSFLDDVMVHGFGGALGATVALPSFGGWDPPGTLENGVLGLDGLARSGLARRDEVVVPALHGHELVAATVATDAITRTPVHGIDPDLGVWRIEASGIAPLAVRPLDGAAWEEGLAAGRRALATELVAAGRAMLRLAREHALEREQFGRPISTFQAVRHRLAEAYVALEGADAAVVSAWDVPGPLTALLAKSLAGRATRVATTHCQQVLAGIGFTTDHSLHRYVKRAMMLDGLLGSSYTLPRHLGATLLATRHAPRLLDL